MISIFKQMIMRDFHEEVPYELQKIMSNYKNSDDYDDHVIEEIGKISQIDFIKGMQKEIDIKTNAYRASMLERHVFENIEMYYDNNIDSQESKNMLKEMAIFALESFNEPDTLSHTRLKKFKEKYLDGK